jgi:uncharacterized membrane protein YdjX (TVP38/TMEM64 family)
VQSQNRWSVIALILFAIIVVPFMLFNEQSEQWVESFLDKPHSGYMSATVLASLLVGDVFMPVPSSLVSAGCGYLLGKWVGSLVSWVGMTLGCIVGYAIALAIGKPVVKKLVGDAEVERLHALGRRYGDWTLIICRPIPVLAEASVMVAGMGSAPWRRVLALTALSNAGISLFYAWVGAHAMEIGSFLWAFVAAVLIPSILMFLANRLGRFETLR